MMKLYLYNTLKRQKEEFVPIDQNKIRLYACGPTVYNYAHIGNARPAVIFDLLTRLLRHIYGGNRVTYTRNITDIDDKIIDVAKAMPSNRSIEERCREITTKYAKIYNDDMGMLGVAKPDFQPKATDYIPNMVYMILKLIHSNHAYVHSGHVLFRVSSFSSYGELSRRNREQMIHGARVEVAPFKEDPADFVLWKPSADDQPGWFSPWGRGRPGWHLECSAMNEAINGDHFDIHAGGEDLIFPHHENEIAQSVCAHGGTAYANYWLHNGHLMVEGRKMSKSLGNFLLVHDLINGEESEVERKVMGEVIRFTLLSAHYRSPFDWTSSLVEQRRRDLDKLYELLRQSAEISPVRKKAKPPAEFMRALLDDLNTPLAIAELMKIAHKLRGIVRGQAEKIAETRAELLAAGKLLGLLQKNPNTQWRYKHRVLYASLNVPLGEVTTTALSDSEIEDLVIQRKIAKQKRDFERADSIRNQLMQHKILLEDDKKGETTWRRGA